MTEQEDTVRAYMPARDSRPPSLSIFWTSTRKLLTHEERVEVSCIGCEVNLSPHGHLQLIFQGRGITVAPITDPGVPKYPSTRRESDAHQGARPLTDGEAAHGGH